jgi:hypothetical protein
MRYVLFWLGTGFLLATAFPAAADTLRLSNCTTEAEAVETFNESDFLCWVPRSRGTLPSCGTVTFDCDGKCKVKTGGGGTYCGQLSTLGGERTRVTAGFVETSAVRGGDPATWSRLCTCDQAKMQW